MKESNAPAAALPQYREPEQSGRPLWLRVAAFDDEEIELRFSFAQRDCGLVVRRAIAVERRAIARKFEHDGPRTHLALRHLAAAAAHQKASAESPEWHHVGGHVRLVALGIGDVDMRDPVTSARRRRGWRGGRIRLHAIMALDDHEVADRMGKPQRSGALVFRRAIASKGDGIVGKF